jgi:hypothetical protein
MAAINVRNLTDRRNFSRAMSATQPTSLHQTCNAEYVIGIRSVITASRSLDRKPVGALVVWKA